MKIPNMDLIEDVSRASQNMTHELINTNTGFMPAQDESFDGEEVEMIPPPVPTAQGNVEYHHGSHGGSMDNILEIQHNSQADFSLAPP